MFLRFHSGCCVSRNTGGPFKVKGSLLGEAYSSLGSGSPTTAIKVSKSRQLKNKDLTFSSVKLYLHAKFYSYFAAVTEIC